MQPDGSITTAWFPPGLNGNPTSVEGWPVWQLNDLLSFYVAYDNGAQADWNAYTPYLAANNIPIVCYEGGYQGISIDGPPVLAFVSEDQMNHPSFRDAYHRFLVFEQLGDWTTTGSGSIASSIYTWCGSGGTPGNPGWKIAAGPTQSPGLGLSNSYFLPQAAVGGNSSGGNTFNILNGGVGTGYAHD